MAYVGHSSIGGIVGFLKLLTSLLIKVAAIVGDERTTANHKDRKTLLISL